MFSLVPNFILQALICGQLCDNMSYLNEVLMLVMLDSFKSSDCHAWRHNPSYHIIALAVCILFDFCLLPGRQDAFLQSSPTPVAPSSLAAMLMIRYFTESLCQSPQLFSSDQASLQAAGDAVRRLLARHVRTARLQTLPSLPAQPHLLPGRANSTRKSLRKFNAFSPSFARWFPSCHPGDGICCKDY